MASVTATNFAKEEQNTGLINLCISLQDRKIIKHVYKQSLRPSKHQEYKVTIAFQIKGPCSDQKSYY